MKFTEGCTAMIFLGLWKANATRYMVEKATEINLTVSNVQSILLLSLTVFLLPFVLPSPLSGSAGDVREC